MNEKINQHANALGCSQIAQIRVEMLPDVKPILPAYVVPIDQIIPHEHVDQRRVDSLKNRLQNEGVLQDPPIVISTTERYTLLDGATRFTALKQSGYDHIPVQITPSDQTLRLYSWHHAICHINLNELLELFQSIPEIELTEAEANKMEDQLFSRNGLCYLETIDKRVFLACATTEQKRLPALNSLVNAYIEASHVHRTIYTNLNSLQRDYPNLTALVVFREYSIQQVLQMAQARIIFPAGITRFVIPKRILRLNIPLAKLKSDKSLRQKNRWLHQFINDKINQNKLRLYEESVYLFDR